MDNIYMTIISMVVGYIFKFMANGQENRQKQYEQLIGLHTATNESIDKARTFEPQSWVRRYLGVLIPTSFAVILLGWFSNKPTTVLNIIENSSWFGIVKEQAVIVTEIVGPYYSQDMVQLTFIIVGFYFGTNAADASNKRR